MTIKNIFLNKTEKPRGGAVAEMVQSGVVNENMFRTFKIAVLVRVITTKAFTGKNCPSSKPLINKCKQEEK